jgi:hypothetical protein
MDSLNFDRAAAFYDATRALPERTVHETEIEPPWSFELTAAGR